MSSANLVAIGQIIKPFGVRGEVRVRSLTDLPGRFDRLGPVTIEAPSGRVLETSVTRVRPDREFYVLGFEAFATPEEAAAFRGALIKAEREATQSLPEGQFLECDLLGMTVKTDEGRVLGTLAEVLHTPGHAVFVVRRDASEFLIPGTKQVVMDVDVATSTMTVGHLEGLVDDAV